MMPKLSGFDVCQRAKHALGLQDVYIVLLTAKGQEFDRQRGQEVGADLYMTKPFDPDALLRKAREVLASNAAMTRVPMAAQSADYRQAAGGKALVDSHVDVDGSPVPSRTPHGIVLHGTPPWTVRPLSRDRSTAPRSGGSRARPAAAVVARCSSTSLTKEVERRALATEVLNLYREVNLIYSFSESWQRCSTRTVARLTLEEARHLITASDGAIILLDESHGELSPGGVR